MITLVLKHNSLCILKPLLNLTVPGFGTENTNNLRLWSSKPSSGEFDFQKFNSGDYESAVRDQQRAETISAVLYPNDKLVLSPIFARGNNS